MADSEELLDIRQAATLLGVSPTSLRRWTNSGVLPHLRLGNRRERRFRRRDLLALLQDPPAATAIASPVARQARHLCRMCISKSERLALGARFALGGLQRDEACLVISRPKRRLALLEELGRGRPGLEVELRDRRLIPLDFAASSAGQLEQLEQELGRAVAAGAVASRILMDMSDGGPERGRSFDRVLLFEREYDRRVVRVFPVTTLCLYDARRMSGLDLLAALQAHPECFAAAADS